jgi:hypothetical protein
MMEIFSFMQKILFLICIAISCIATISFVHASGTLDVTSQNFSITLSGLDPLGDSHSSTTTIGGGIKAFESVISKITRVLLFIIPTLAGISLLIAGYFYIFSAGDSEKAWRAKTIIKWNIVAIFIAFLSLAIVNLVASFFNT